MLEIIFKGSPQPEQGLKSFYGDYNESRFDSKKTADVISVPSSPDDKSPIEIADSNEVNHARFWDILTFFPRVVKIKMVLRLCQNSNHAVRK